MHSRRADPRRLVVTAILLVGLLGATGCRQDSSPTPRPLDATTPGETPSGSATATPDSPALPTAAVGTSPRAAKAFVRHWVATYNDVVSTGDVGRLRALSSNGCSSCQGIADRIDRVYSSGGSIETRGWTVRELTVLPAGGPRGSRTVAASIASHPQRVVVEAGAQPEDFDGGRIPFTFRLRSAGGSWTVVRLTRAA